MNLEKGLKFIQDNTLKCEVLGIVNPKRIKGKRVNGKVIIRKNEKIVEYDLDCFQKSFNTGLIYGSFKILEDEKNI